MDKKYQIRNSTAEFLMFTSQSETDSIEIMVFDENVWLTQDLIAELFGKGRSRITEHIRNILSEELDEDSVCRKFRRTAKDGKSYREIAPDIIRPSAEECNANSRARSTKMRWAIKA